MENIRANLLSVLVEGKEKRQFKIVIKQVLTKPMINKCMRTSMTDPNDWRIKIYALLKN